jgi:putative peptidoglycan lipid II flippase
LPLVNREGRVRHRIGRALMREFGVAEASVLLAGSFFLSAVLGAVRQVLLNARFGTGDEASAYYAAARLPETLFTLVAGGALWNALIPVLVGTRREKGEPAARRLADIVLTACLVVSAGIVVVGEIGARDFVAGVLAPGFDATTTELTARLTRILLLQSMLLTAGSVAVAVLNARNRFLLPALALTVHNLAEIAGIGAAWLFPGVGIYGPACGVVVGSALQALVPFAVLWRREWRPRWVWAPRDTGLRAVVRLLVPNGLSLGVGYAGGVVDTSFASRAPEQGAVPALTNAWLLENLPVRLVGVATAQAAFPRLATGAASEAWGWFRATAARAAAAAIALALPAAVGLALLAHPVVRILFEHGEFGPEAASLTARLVVIYALGLPLYAATEVLTRTLVALRDTRTPLVTNTVQLGVRVAMMAALLGRLGVEVVPVAFAASSALETAMLAGVLWRRVRKK